MFIKKIFALLFLFIISITTSGCIQVNTNKKEPVRADGGFFVSLNSGEAWEQRTAILSTKGIERNFSMEGVSVLAIDPSDPKAIYYGTVNQGLVYTYDRGKSWQVALGLGRGTISSIAIDPEDKCTIYVSIGKKLFKTDDCSRTWDVVFVDKTAKLGIVTTVVDHFNPNNIYVVLPRGDIIKSTDKGESWQTIYRFKKKINKFFIDPNDSRKMYAALDKAGLYQSDDSGNNWKKNTKIFSNFKIGTGIVDFDFFKNQPNLMFVATKQGILKSIDGGETWEQLPLLPPKTNAHIQSIAINPKNINEIYYITGSTLYRSIDGGKNWMTKILPTSRKSKILMIDKELPNILYLAISPQ